MNGARYKLRPSDQRDWEWMQPVLLRSRCLPIAVCCMRHPIVHNCTPAAEDMEGSGKGHKPERMPSVKPAAPAGAALPGPVLRTRTLQRSATGERVVRRMRTPHPRIGAFLPRGEDADVPEDQNLEPLKVGGRGAWFAALLEFPGCTLSHRCSWFSLARSPCNVIARCWCAGQGADHCDQPRPPHSAL